MGRCCGTDLKKYKLNKEWMHIAQHRAKWRSIVALQLELNEEAEEMEIWENVRGMKEMRGTEY